MPTKQRVVSSNLAIGTKGVRWSWRARADCKSVAYAEWVRIPLLSLYSYSVAGNTSDFGSDILGSNPGRSAYRSEYFSGLSLQIAYGNNGKI